MNVALHGCTTGTWAQQFSCGAHAGEHASWGEPVVVVLLVLVAVLALRRMLRRWR